MCGISLKATGVLQPLGARHRHRRRLRGGWILRHLRSSAALRRHRGSACHQGEMAGLRPRLRAGLLGPATGFRVRNPRRRHRDGRRRRRHPARLLAQAPGGGLPRGPGRGEAPTASAICFSGLMGTVPNTTYSTSISVTALTGVGARSVGVALGASRSSSWRSFRRRSPWCWRFRGRSRRPTSPCCWGCSSWSACGSSSRTASTTARA